MPKTRKDIHHVNAGEWSNKVAHRIDHEKHGSALRQGKNVISWPHGPVNKRKGFELVAPAKYDDKKWVPIRFRFNKSDTVLIEVGDEYMRFHTNGQQLRETPIVLASATAANPVVVTAGAGGAGIINGDEVFVNGCVEMPELNGRWFKVANATVTTFELNDREGLDIDGSTWTAETTGGTVAKVYEIATVYAEADLANLDYAQKNDVLWICDGAHPVQRLIRFYETNWTIEEYEYVFPAVLDPNVDNDKTLTSNQLTGTGATITAAGHAPFSANSVGAYLAIRHTRPAAEVSRYNATMAGGSNITGHQIAVLGDVTFETAGTWTGKLRVFKSKTAEPSFSAVAMSEWVEVGVYTSTDDKNFNVRFTETNETRYYVCDLVSGTVAATEATLRSEAALIEGAVKITGYTDSTHVTATIISDLISTDATTDWSEGAWSASKGYPAVIALYEKSLWLARTLQYPQGIWKSETDLFDNFKVGVNDTSGMFFELDSKERNDILWMVDQDKLMVGTSGSDWTVSGTDLNSIISPTNIVSRRQGNKGSKDVRPETVDDVVMYVQRGGRESIRALAYSIERDKFRAEDMQAFSDHLTQSGITSMAFQSAPDPVLWCTTGDGRLLSFTYERDQNVFAWNPHETEGLFESVETIYGSEDDEVWVAAKRTINGKTRRTVERMTGYYNPPERKGVASGGANGSGQGTGLMAFIIDLSGSMQDDIDESKLQAIKLAREMASRYTLTRFALFTIADVGNTVVLKTDFTDVETVIDLIGDLTVKATGTENGFEAIVRACDELSWDEYGNSSNRQLVMISDEDSDLSETQANAISAVVNRGVVFSYGNGGTGSGVTGYEPIKAATNGSYFGTAGALATTITSILDSAFDHSSEVIFLDSCAKATFNAASPDSTLVGGLWHLEGHKVDAYFDGIYEKGLTVTNGQVDLGVRAYLAYVGLPYSAVVQPLRIDADSNMGSSRGYTKVISSLYVSLINTTGLKVVEGGKEREVAFRSGVQDQSLPPQLFTGEIEILTNTGHELDPQFTLIHDYPLPFTVAAFVVHYDVTG